MLSAFIHSPVKCNKSLYIFTRCIALLVYLITLELLKQLTINQKTEWLYNPLANDPSAPLWIRHWYLLYSSFISRLKHWIEIVLNHYRFLKFKFKIQILHWYRSNGIMVKAFSLMLVSFYIEPYLLIFLKTICASSWQRKSAKTKFEKYKTTKTWKHTENKEILLQN
jgi:hypothetical protein